MAILSPLAALKTVEMVVTLGDQEAEIQGTMTCENAGGAKTTQAFLTNAVTALKVLVARDSVQDKMLS